MSVSLYWTGGQDNNIIVSMIPPYDHRGNLPPGVHESAWEELENRFGWNSHRQELIRGLRAALSALRAAGCRTVFVNGSFVTAKDWPADFDGCWDIDGVDPALLDPVLLDFSEGRRAQKAKYRGELFPVEPSQGAAGRTFL